MQTQHVDEYLPELAMGVLAGADLATVEGHLRGCSRCERELAATQDLIGDLALALPPDPPPAELRARVLDSAGGGPSKGRFAMFVEQLAALCDVAADKARELLDLIDTASAWEPGPNAGSRLVHLDRGPALAADTLVGFVRVEPGVEFPFHRHLGDETVLILQGALRDSDGSTARRGDVVFRAGGSEHSFVATGEVPLVYLVVLEKGVEFPGLPGFVV